MQNYEKNVDNQIERARLRVLADAITFSERILADPTERHSYPVAENIPTLQPEPHRTFIDPSHEVAPAPVMQNPEINITEVRQNIANTANTQPMPSFEQMIIEANGRSEQDAA